MSGYVVLVDFHIKPGALETFRELVDINARRLRWSPVVDVST